jgi:hypothetical protein
MGCSSAFSATPDIASDPAALTFNSGTVGASYTNRWIEITDAWRYHVNNEDLGTAWKLTDYSDRSWVSGGGLLYVESSSLPAAKTTELGLTKPIPTTCYFRTWFTNDLSNAGAISLVANTVIDDGVVLYLNGTEVLRNGLADGTVSYDTLADNVGDAVNQGPFTLDASALVSGTNLLAAEVHQSSTSSSDIVMGLTLDVVWTEITNDTNAPVVAGTDPVAGSTVSELTQIQVNFNEGVQGVDASDLLMNGTAASSVEARSTSEYIFQFAKPAEGSVLVSWVAAPGITDLSTNLNVFAGVDFGYLYAPPSPYSKLAFSGVYQSSNADASTTADQAVDDSSSSYSLTDNLAGSYWVAELGRAYELQQIELVNRAAPDDAAMEGLTLSILNMDDQVVYESVLSNPGSGGVTAIRLPAGTVGRMVRIGLSGSDTNGAGTYEVGLAEVRAVGVAQIPTMPEPFAAEEVVFEFSVWQTTDYSSDYPADQAVDADSSTFSHTDTSTTDNYWIADMLQERLIDSVDLVDRSYSDLRMEGYTLRILDEDMVSVASTVTTDPGSGGTFTFTPPDGTYGRYVKVGLENGDKNGKGDTAIQLAEVKIWSDGYNVISASSTTAPTAMDNLATSKRCYMLRLHDGLEPATNVNDGDMNTEAVTTTQTVDGYWEVDLGETYALYGVRAVSAVDVGDRLTNTICRLFDENHDSVLEKPVTGSAPAFDVDLDGPVYARYVRIGLEDKTRTDGTPGGYIGFREVEVFGVDADQVGIVSFTASDTTVSAGGNVTLDWSVEEVKRAEIYPSIGSVGSNTGTNGIGTRVQNMTESTEFIMVATNHAGLFTSAVGVEVDDVALPVVISEVVADNGYSLEDGYGDASDWIELRNTGNSTVDLTGWGLSDNPVKPLKWIFPSTNIAPHSTLIVFASNNEVSIDPEGSLHASFSLSKDGETLLLTASDGITEMDRITYPELDSDLAYGRDLDGRWTFMEPTPGAVNTGSTYEGWLNPLDWSHARGFYETNFTLSVTSEDAESTVLYSLDGSEPSIPYTGGLAITSSSVVRVQAVWPGYKPARIQTKTFLFLDDVIAHSSMDSGITQDSDYVDRVKPGLLALPTLSLVVSAPGKAIDAIEYDEQACSLEILWPDGQDAIQEDCGIARFGGAYSYFEKKAFSLAFRKEYGKGKLSAPLFNGFDRGTLARTSFDRLHLRGGNHDWTRSFGMSDRFIQDSYLDMGSLNPHGRFVHVYLNGEYWGQYNCKEVLNEAFLADYLGGSEDDYVSVKGNDNGGGGPDGWVIGAGDPPNPEPWENVRNLMGDYEAVSAYLDVSHYIDYMLLYGFGGCENEFRACGPREAGSGFKFWLNDPDGFINDDRVGDDKSIGTYGPGGIWDALHAEGHADFKILLADRIYKNFFNDGALTTAQCTSRLKARMDETRDSFIAECARWNRSYTSWETSANTAYTSYFTHQAGDMVAAWRTDGYYPSFDPPTFGQYGGSVPEGYQPTLTSSAGAIYYTLDGTDPRLPGGDLHPAALTWTAGAVTIAGDTTITTRVRTSGGEWSALAEPRYLLGSRITPDQGDLLITEIQYNPAGSDEYEFLEIWNAGTNLIDLTGVSISNAMHYVFPDDATLLPGDFVVVVEDETAFASRYQNAASPWYWEGIAVAGEWVGGLSDSGETIDLVASNGMMLFTVSYRNDGDWPDAPDGDGPSLQLSYPNLVPIDLISQTDYLNDGLNWSASSLYHGSPGRLESAEVQVVINEVLAHTDVGVDWIELYNPGSSTADLSGFALTDALDRTNPYLLPEGTTIEAGGYLTLSASILGFGFSELGSDAALLELSGGSNIVRIVDQVSLPAVEREEPLGRYERSDGVVDFTELLSITPGAANALPRVGPVVISEIMYAPAAGYSAYIEIMNISSETVPLYDEAIPTNTWAVSGIGDFSFPEGTVLAPLTTALLCETNAAAFRAQYGVPESIQVFGAWPGGLASGGEKVQLLYPGDPELDGFVPMYRADHVTYRTSSAWPVAWIGGISLERNPVEAYGNDPASWQATWGGTPGQNAGSYVDMDTSISVASGNEPGIAFSAVIGEAYEIRYTDSLIDPDWHLLHYLPSVTTNWVEVVDPAATNQTRFYRIIWHP